MTAAVAVCVVCALYLARHVVAGRVLSPVSQPANAAAERDAAEHWTNRFPRFDGNRPLVEHPPIRPNSQAMLDLLARSEPEMVGPGINDAQSTFYDARKSDPTHIIHCREPWGPAPMHLCSVEGKAIHIPAGAVPGANTDHHVSVVDPNGCTVYDFWQAQDLDSPVVSVEFAAQTDRCRGTGFTQDGGAGATAGDASLELGRSPLTELRTGVIHHALEAAPACNNGGPPPMVGQATNGSAQACKFPGPGIPMGAYLWSDVQPDALPATLDRATRMICTALNRYGAVVSDTSGGWYGIQVNALWHATDPDYRAWAEANMSDGKTDPAACFPGRDWPHHMHVLDWTRETRRAER